MHSTPPSLFRPRTLASIFCVVSLSIPVTTTAEAPVAARRHLNLAPAAFAAANNAAQYVIEEGGVGRLCSLKGAVYLVTSLKLDDGATVEDISVILEDKSEHSLGMMSLVRHTPTKPDVLAITPVSTGAHDTETLSTDKIANPVVDNQNFSYLLQVMLSGPNVCLRGAQVTYRTP